MAYEAQKGIRTKCTTRGPQCKRRYSAIAQRYPKRFHKLRAVGRAQRAAGCAPAGISLPGGLDSYSRQRLAWRFGPEVWEITNACVFKSIWCAAPYVTLQCQAAPNAWARQVAHQLV